MLVLKHYLKHFSTTKSAKSKKSLPAKVKYTKRVKQGVGHVTYSGYLKKKSVKKSGGKYVATYSGTLKRTLVINF